MTLIRLAIVGCGAAARGCHVPALPPLVGDLQLTALIDRDPRQARAALDLYRELGGADADRVVIATDPAEAADAFDAAVVVVPHTLHAQTVEPLLAAGKHVLLEKPMSTSAEDARRLAARAVTPVLAMAHPRRLFPAYAWVKRLIDGGDLGEVVRVDWAEGHPYAWEPVTWSMFDRRLAGGGVLTDTGSHVFDTLLWWLGPDVEVVRYEDNSLGGVETDASSHLRFGSVDVHCEFSRLRDLGISCKVTGTKATATIGTDFPAGECSLITADGVELHRGDVDGVAPAQDEWELLFTEQLVNFAAAIRGTAQVHSGPEDGVRVVELIQDCYGGGTADERSAPQPWTTRGDDAEAGSALAGRTVAVTGASGFIGGRLVERLILGTQARVRPVVRGFGRAARLSVLPQERLEFRQADLLDTEGLRAAFEGCDTVVHCAFGNTGTEAERWAMSVEGTAGVLAAARAAGVRRVVHLSTVDVYDPTVTGELTEESPARPADPADREYEQQKLAAERLVLDAHGLGLETVVLQPGVVYGPWGGQWTTVQLQRPEGDFAVLPAGGGTGVCNAVYVDDLADAVLLAIEAEAAAGQRFLVGNGEPLGWGGYFDAIRSLRGLGGPGAQSAGDPVPDWELELYRSAARAQYDKARHMLGFTARTSFAEGIALTRQWADWAGHLPKAGA
ncbi:NAD-dependent epimerase/dehydratase family protein [Streptomyces sp. NPDC007861]|uniref:NAD-dependent epimerase/dehydratase family protein n=1 Tax=Streptomyces sp. NPDC007861 TaxID=3154893 RepID=UPI0033E982F1